MQLLVVLSAVAFVAVVCAEPRFRWPTSAESGLLRRANMFFRKRGGSWTVPAQVASWAEKRRARELFGKRSAPPDVPEEDVAELPEDQYQSMYESMMQLHRDRRGRVRELFG
ncbi:hypothetical protein Y032_0177g600 [Ancylostoma ceylanicum]|uniref:Uncharacterized protein n=1 Tax=Ancylostoma ceylanicum TaxID=53326 RepID=A0A016SUE7_9BILA|nr:hypothetical protein Y032_0177g600 [Ancylostoma ceylanicum]